MTTKSFQLNLNNCLFDLSSPVIMGVVNATPDSFFSGNRLTSDKQLLNRVEQHLKDGAKIIDLGGYSTRPGADVITVEEEIKRLSDALDIILKKFPQTIISVDTFRSTVARHVVEKYGVAIINDIGGGTLDNIMFETIADLKVAYVLMHTRGNPGSMSYLTDYEDVVSEVFAFLAKRVAQLHLHGVKDVIIDPGLGFAKTTEQNFQLLNKLAYFHELDCPILAGLSRKSMIYKTLNTRPEEALNGTTALNMLALSAGAQILRVHDVKEAAEAIQLFKAFEGQTK